MAVGERDLSRCLQDEALELEQQQRDEGPRQHLGQDVFYCVIYSIVCTIQTRDGERKCNSASAKLGLSGASYRKADPTGESGRDGDINTSSTHVSISASQAKQREVHRKMIRK